MQCKRPAKDYIRQQWAEVIDELTSFWNNDEVLYTTLTGAEAYDIKLLIDRGLLERTESGAIAEKDSHKVIAVESNLDTIRKLKFELPGLNVVPTRIEEIVGGHRNPLSFPDKKNKEIARARVLNLDYNSSLKLESKDGEFIHDQLEVVRKLALLHGRPELREPWCMFLTLNGSINWDKTVQTQVFAHIGVFMDQQPTISQNLQAILGDRTFGWVQNGFTGDIVKETPDIQQKVLSIFVPGRIASITSRIGWKVTTRASWCYGGETGAAPMCTWILYFNWDARYDSQPEIVLKDSLASLLDNCGIITSGGKFIASIATSKE
jgi:hypothetical protein